MEDEKLVTRLSLFLVVFNLIIKITIEFFTNSLSFFAELSDSILDFVVVFITYIALRESKKPADNEHMFGHYKVNSMAGFIQGLIIIGLYVSILYQAISILIKNQKYEKGSPDKEH